MKKRNYITYQALTAVTMMATALLGTSCATDRTFLEDDEVPIRMAVACQEMTRGTSGASSQESAFDADAKINVTITTSDATPVSICNGSIFTASAPSGGTNTLNPPDPTRPPYYPNGDKTVTIKAFYPSTVNTGTTSFAVQTDQTTVSTTDETADTYKKSDLMTATVTGQVKTASDVNLQFQHRMAKITVSATATDGLTIQSINLANVQTTASYASATDSWSGSGSTGTITVATAEASEKLTTLSGVALFPSQAIEGKTFIQVVTNKGTANYAVTSKLFQESYDYTANLEVGLQNLTMTAAITDWNNATGSATVTKVNKYGISIDPISESFTYDGTAKVPATVTVKFKKAGESDKTLTLNTDYTLAYYNNTDVGEALIVASGKAGTDYAGSAAVQSYVIGKATPSVTFTDAAPIPVEYDWNGNYTNAIAAGSKYDGVTTWTSSDEDIAAVDGNGLVSIFKPGTVIIKFATDGSGNYEATSAQYTLTITKRSFKNHASITSIGEYTQTYDGTAKEPITVVYDGGTSGTRLFAEQNHYTVNYSNNINAGTATITCTGGGTYYDNSVITYNYTITKATPVITMTTDDRTIGLGSTYQCDATTTIGTITYSSSDANIASVNSSTGVVSALKAGTVTITAAVAAGDNWNASTSKTISITVESLEKSWTDAGSSTYPCPATAIYTFEVVGAAGGAYSGAAGGKGGIVKASKKLEAGTIVYIYVGGGGTQGQKIAGGANGSGTGNGGMSGTGGGGSGGAASEIRIGGTSESNRQIVAGGGGGSLGRRRGGGDGGSSSSGNNSQSDGQDASYRSVGAGGGGGYLGGTQGIFGGAFGGSNYAASGWTVISNGTSTNGATSNSDTNIYNGYIKVTYEFE